MGHTLVSNSKSTNYTTTQASHLHLSVLLTWNKGMVFIHSQSNVVRKEAMHMKAPVGSACSHGKGERTTYCLCFLCLFVYFCPSFLLD